MTADPTARARSEVVVVRPLTPEDVAATATLQAAAAPSAQLDVPAALGAGFLSRWQRAHLASPHGVALVAERAAGVVVDDDASAPSTGPCGVLLAVRDVRAHRAHLLHQHGRDLLRAGAAASLTDPRPLSGWVRLHGGPLVSAVTMLPTRGGSAARARKAPGDAAAGADVVLESVAVDGSSRGTGVGRQLLQTLAAEASASGARRLVAHVPWGSGAEGFFTACGWTASTTRPSPRGGFATRVHLDL